MVTSTSEVTAQAPVKALRDRCFNLYWRMRDRITPGLEYTQAVYERVLARAVNGETCWLDLGCGHQILPPWRLEEELQLARSAKRVVGADYDLASLKAHVSIRERVRSDIERLPFRAETFDLVTANMVVEHVADPERLLKEVWRILKPGGRFIMHTPNRRGYNTVAARLLPEFVKPRLALLLSGRPEADVFRTYYRLNSERTLRQLAGRAGFSAVSVDYLVSDAQLVIVPPLAAVELLLIRALMTRPFRRLRMYLIAELQKPA